MSVCRRYAIVLVISLSQFKRASSNGLVYSSHHPGRSRDIPDEFKNTEDFIVSNGYPVEIHQVTTDDGYILAVHRIPHGRKGSNNSSSKPVALIQHGISGSSDNWVLSGSKAFPFILADDGFDVWLPNSRGNSYSKRHRNSTISDAQYWDFSFHEQGYYDMASSIDYALLKSRQSKLFLIGHSKGTTSGLALLSLRPEYNEKIALFINFGPIAYLKNAKSPIVRALAKNLSTRQAKEFVQSRNINAFPSLTDATRMMRLQMCGIQSPVLDFCLRFLFLINGFSNELVNRTLLPSYFTHFPNGGGIKEMLHYMQIAQTDRFAVYDLGKKKNILVYGRSKPPEYPLHKVTAPMSFLLTRNDYLVSDSDFQKLFLQIRKYVVNVSYVEHPTFNHIDIMWGMKADELVYKPTIALMRKYLVN